MLAANVFGYSTLAGIATLVGVWLVFYKEKWARENSIYLISFAAGIMLATAFIHIIPESMKLMGESAVVLFKENSGLMILIGILIFYFLQTFMMFHSHNEEHETHQIGILSLIGLGFHSLLDGIAIFAGFEASPELGALTTLAVLLHEFPEGLMTTSILLHAGMERTKVILYSVLVAVATPVGAIASFFFLRNIISGTVLGIMLALAAGSFVYVAAVELIPETQRELKIFNVASLIVGVLFIVVLTQIFGE